ncbi:hypothetical protein LTS15_006659 [Exophiala xenobiotica]|nr:hypothetical protein LTS15_006659 [Exophiala xenobiotica]
MTGHGALSPGERNYEKKLAAVPEWYLVARSARPQLSQHVDTLLYGPNNGERGFRKQIPDVDAQRWVEVERQISDQMPAEFDALVTLQKHVNTFTACDPKVIAGLFAGLETEEERLAVVLGSHVTFPDTEFPRSLGMETSVGESPSLLTRDQEEAADDEDDDANDSDEAVLLYGPEEAKADQKRTRAEAGRRRRQNRKKRKQDLVAEATTQAKKQLDGRPARQPSEDPAPEAKTQAKRRLKSRPARQPNERQRQTDRARSKRSQAPEPEPRGQANGSASQRGDFRRSSRDAKETPRDRGYMEQDTTGIWRRISA